MIKRIRLLKILIGLALMIIFTYLYRKKLKKMQREEVLKLAKKLREEMQQILQKISQYVKSNKNDQLNKQNKNRIKEMFIKQIRDKKLKIFYQYSQKIFFKNIHQYYQNDSQINYYVNQHKEEFQLALCGKFKSSVIIFVNSEQVLDVINQLLESKIQRLQQKTKEKITLHEMVLRLIEQKQQQKLKRSLKLREFGFIGKDQELAQIFQFLVAQFCQIDQNFYKKYQELLELYRTKSNQHVDMFCSFPRSPSQFISDQK